MYYSRMILVDFSLILSQQQFEHLIYLFDFKSTAV
jgi:hypothetical protein